ncbi:hypothetical protein B0T13DRAFT_317155 [Neurospora crassa]|nr:hypothetical protein B0T13DRAFT_317155 [Neurospora crassa]
MMIMMMMMHLLLPRVPSQPTNQPVSSMKPKPNQYKRGETKREIFVKAIPQVTTLVPCISCLLLIHDKKKGKRRVFPLVNENCNIVSLLPWSFRARQNTNPNLNSRISYIP